MPKIGEQNLKNPLENPAQAQAELAKATSDSGKERPFIEYPESNLVELPAGYVDSSGSLHTTATVRELTGADEELMAKAMKSKSPFHYIETVLERGTEKIGPYEGQEKNKALMKMLVADREQLFVAIRVATYGPEVKQFGWVCPFCQNQTEFVKFALNEDIEVKRLDDPVKDREFEVVLRKGEKVRMKFPDGEDQKSLFEDPSLTKPEVDSKILSMCITRYTDSSGNELPGAFLSSLPLQMAALDRKKLVQELTERTPGPQLNRIEFNCEACGEKVSLAVGLEELFLNFELL